MLITQNNAQQSRQWFIDLFSIAICIGLFYAIWIGSYALFTPDEGRYSEVAREMIVSGDFITPRLNGVVFMDKPILYYWLQAIAMMTFGIKEWALRFWPAFFGVFGCVMTYIAGRLLYNRRTGILSAIILAGSPIYYGASHYANLDLEVAVLISTSLLSFIIAMHSSSQKIKNGFLFVAYLFAGLAALTKGLIGIAFPALIIGSWILLLNRWSTLREMRLISGLLIFILVTAPWYILVQKANPEFFDFFFVKQQVSRFLTTDSFNNITPIWFYIPIVIAGLFPWCVFGLQALFLHLKNLYQHKQKHAVELFLLLWFIIIFTFFSIPKSKTVGYILPIFPALALIIGSYLDQMWNKPKNNGIYFGIFVFIISCLGIIATCFTLPKLQIIDISPPLIPYFIKIAGIFLISGIIFLGLFFKKKELSSFFFTLILTASAFLLLISASCDVINDKTAKPIALELRKRLQSDDEVVTYFKYYQDLPIYIERQITIVADWQAKDIPLRDNWVRELWYGMSFQDTKQWLINEDTFWKRWHSKKRLYVLLNSNYLNQFNRKGKITFYKIAQYNDLLLLSNKKPI